MRQNGDLLTWRSLWSRTARLVGATEARRVVERAAECEALDWIGALDQPAGAKGISAVAGMVDRLQSGEPLQYVLGRWGFRGLDLIVDTRALIPRPETEQVVDQALAEMARTAGRVVADLGTGGGAIALSLLKETARSEIWAVDSSVEAISLATENLSAVTNQQIESPICKEHLDPARAHFLVGSWYEALPERLQGEIDLVVSNPPYVSEDEIVDLPPQVWEWEPRNALVAGPTGREAIAAVLECAPTWLARPGVAVVEIAPGQADQALEMACRFGFDFADVRLDLAGRPRTLVARVT